MKNPLCHEGLGTRWGLTGHHLTVRKAFSMNVRKISAAAALLSLLLSALMGQAQNGPPPVPWPKPYLVVEAWGDRPYVADLYVYDLNGKRLQRLTQEPLPSCYNPVLSPDGSELVFTANAMNLYALSLRYNLINALYVGTPGAAAFSANGRRLAFVGRTSEADPRASLYVSPLYEEMKKTPVAPIPLDADPNDIQDLTFSPDRSPVLYVQWKGDHADLRVCDLATRTCSTLLSQPAASFYEPTFSPDGKTLLFVREDHEVYSLMSLSPMSLHPLLRGLVVFKTFPRGRDLSMPTFTRDGKHIVFSLGGVIGWMGADGQNDEDSAEGLSGPLPVTDLPPLRGFDKRARPARFRGAPFDVGQNYVIYTEWKNEKSALMMVDLRTKTIRKVPLAVSHLSRALLVE